MRQEGRSAATDCFNILIPTLISQRFSQAPKSSTHVGYLLAGRLPPAYEPQILHNMWITGAQFADFVSFDPRLPEHLQLFRIRIERNDAAVNDYVAECMSFLSDVENTIKLLNEKVPPCAAT
jgi:hypothetical protein